MKFQIKAVVVIKYKRELEPLGTVNLRSGIRDKINEGETFRTNVAEK